MLARASAYLCLLLWVVTVPLNVRAQAIAQDATSSACVARELWRRPLIVEGERELYLEPVVFVVSGDRVLLAGKPSYIWLNRRPGATADLESRHVVFGAVIEADGSARTVPAPPVNGGKATAVAAIGAEAGGWRIIVAELDSIAESPQVITAYWLGFYDGAQWSALERLPGPEGRPLLYDNSSRLVQNGDTILWAAVTELPTSRRGVTIFERRAGAWTHHTPATDFASGAELLHTPNLGFALSVHNRKSVLNGEEGRRYSTTSLSLYPRRTGWTFHRKIELGEDPTIVGGKLGFSGETGVVTWFRRIDDASGSRLELRAMIGAIVDRDEPILTVDEDAAPQFAPVLGAGETAWVTHHWIESADSSDAGELRLVALSGGAAQVLWRAPQPFLGPFVATYSGGDVLIVGPRLDIPHQLLVSLMIRLRIECEGSEPPSD